MSPRRKLLLTTLTTLTALTLGACASNDTAAPNDAPTGGAPTWGKPGAPPLSVSTAAAALCGGAGNRQSDGSHAGRNDGEDYGGAAAGGSGGGYGGYWSEPAYDAGVFPGDTFVPEPPPVDAGAECDGPTDAAPDAAEVPDALRSDAAVDPDGPDATQFETRSQAVGEAAPVCEGVDLYTPRVLFMSADDSNSMASPVILRRQIAQGAPSVPPYLVRSWEFLNYYRFDFDRPAAGDLAVEAKLGSCDLTQDFALQIAVQAEAPAGDARAPVHFVLVLDTSGSMDGEPMNLEKAAVRALAQSMRAGDRVSAVTWAEQQFPLIEGRIVEGPNDPALLDLAAGLFAEGGTNLEGGLTTGYALAARFHEEGVLERVILISDGMANVGVTSEELIGAAADDADGEGTYLVGVGVGDGVNDTLMDTVTDTGRGAYVYLDSEAEAERVFVDRFAETVLVAARAVRIRVTLPPYFNVQKFFGEVYSPDPQKVRPQHLGMGDAMVLQQILRPCDASLPRESDELAVDLTWQDPVSGIARQKHFVHALGDLDVADPRLTKAAVILGYAETLQALEPLDPGSRRELISVARQQIRDFDAELADPDLAEIDGLLAMLARANGAE